MKNNKESNGMENLQPINEEILNIKVSLFENYYCTIPYATIGLWEWLLKDSKNIATVQRIRETKDEVLRTKLKKLLPAITPSGIFSIRNKDGLEKHTGLICIDIDGKDNPHITDMELLKDELVKNEFILYCGLSVRGKGLYCLILIAFTEKHEGHFLSLEKDFAELGIIIDKGCKDETRLRGYSYDYKPIVNPWAQVYQKTIDCNETQLPKKMKTKNLLSKNVVIQKTESHILSKEEILKSFLKPTVYHGSVNLKSKSERVRGLVDRIVESRIDITESYNDWIYICSVLINLFGENGQNLFHQVSQFYPNYRFEENDRLYSKLLNGVQRGNSDTLFEIAAKYGIRLTQ